MAHSPWKKAAKDTFAVRLQATEVSGLSIPPIRANYIMDYANSLVGKQLKIVDQVSIFHVHGLIDDLTFDLLREVGFLSALLWFPVIKNLPEYLVSRHYLLNPIPSH